MLTPPKKTIEAIPPSAFRPPHCPRRECPQHTLTSKRAFKYRKAGFFKRKCDGRRVPRFLCFACGRTFSQQSFACTYYMKRPELLEPIAAGLVAGSGLRQLSRSLGCSKTAATKISRRLGRHMGLFHERALGEIQIINEPVVLDHFETFVYSQNDPVGVATAVGQDSGFVYTFDPAPHNRSGRMSPEQKRALKDRSQPPVPPGQYVQSTQRVLDVLAPKVPPGERLQLVSDDHPAYRQALKTHGEAHRFEHLVFANPERGPKGSVRSEEAVKRDRAMFVCDKLHLLIRHSCAHHRRETIAFSRRIDAMIARGFGMLVWRNFVKDRSERKPDRTTPAMALGLTPCQWSWSQVLSRRLFPGRMPVSEPSMKIYRGQWGNPALGFTAEHALVNAF